MNDTDILYNIENIMKYLGGVIDRIAVMHDCSAEYPALQSASKDGVKAMDEIISVLKDMHEVVLESMGAVKIPVKNGDKPTLRLIVNNSKKIH